MKKLFCVFFILILSGCGGGSGGTASAGIKNLSNTKEMIGFSLNGTPGVIDGNDISVVMPYDTNLTSLVATYTATGVKVTAHSIMTTTSTDKANTEANATQVSGESVNDFSNQVIYTVHAEDGSMHDYTVSVHVASNIAKAITAFSIGSNIGIINGNTISVTVPYGTDVGSLVANYTITGVALTVNGEAQVNNQTSNNFSDLVVYTVLAADGSTHEYTVQVTIASNTAKEMTSFSIETTGGVINGNNISVVVPYGTDLTSLVATYNITGVSVFIGESLQVNKQTPNNFTNPVIYRVLAADGSTRAYTVTVHAALNTEKAITSFSIGTSIGIFNGNNISVVVPHNTNVSKLVATFTKTGSSISINDVKQVSGQTLNSFVNAVIYTVTAQDGSTNDYIVSVIVSPDTAKSLLSFSLDGFTGVIQGNNISVVLPYGTTNLTALTATYISNGVAVLVNNVLQVNSETVNNFSMPVTYQVKAADDSITDYIVTVTVAASSAKAITAFALNGISADFIQSNQNIIVTLPFGMDKSSLIASFSTTGELVTVNDVKQVSGETVNNYNSYVKYIVHAADGSKHEYFVYVLYPSNTDKDFISFSLNGYVGIIDGDNILVDVPYGTNVNDMIATYTIRGVSVYYGNTFVLIDSGITSLSYKNLVSLDVKAMDNSRHQYTVKVNVADGTQNNFTSFSLNNIAGVIDGSNIYVTMPKGTDISSLVATYSTTGTSVCIDSNLGCDAQMSSQTVNDFTMPINYKVMALNGSIHDYTVIVNIASATKFVAVGDNGTILISESGGFNWDLVESASTIQTLRSVITDKTTGRIVAVGDNVIITSLDGINWSDVTPLSLSSSLYSITVNSMGEFVAVGDNVVLTSHDGINWEVNVKPLWRLYGITVNNDGLFVAVGYNDGGQALITTSQDGNIWNNIEVPNGANTDSFISIAVDNNGRFVALNELSQAITSTDGIHWVTIELDNITSYYFLGVTVNNKGEFVMFGFGSAFSADGINWNPTDRYVDSMVAATADTNDSKFIAVGANGAMYITYNAKVNWRALSPVTNQSLNAITTY